MPKKKRIVVEVNANFAKAEDEFVAKGGVPVMVTPPLDEDYFIARVRLCRDQAVQVFPKFGIVGCGFAQEEDWNTNLPIACSAGRIAGHIWRNRKYKRITREQVVAAILALQEWCVAAGLEKRERIGGF